MKIKVGVIFGGESVEHEVSVISALQAIEDIDKENLIPSDVSDIIEKTPLVFVKVGINDKKNYSLVKWNEVGGVGTCIKSS